jgi:dihydrofolate synthase / folylpolyglutamate synthase
VDEARGDEVLGDETRTALAGLRALVREPLDLVVIELALDDAAGIASAIAPDALIITSLDVDSSQFPSDDRQRIGFAAAQFMRAGVPAIVSDPAAPASLVDHANQIGADLRLIGRDFSFSGDKQQWAWAGRGRRFNALAYPALRGANQLLNASGALAAFEALRESLPVSAQAVRNGLAMVELPGRLQSVPGQPILVLDIAHNAHAAATLVQNLDQMGFHPRTHVVFGTLQGHDIAATLGRMAPIVDHWRFTDLPVEGAVSAEALRELHARLELKGPGPVTVACHADANEALRQAVEAADPADRIVVFGSVAVVGAVLAKGVPRMPAPHAA